MNRWLWIQYCEYLEYVFVMDPEDLPVGSLQVSICGRVWPLLAPDRRFVGPHPRCPGCVEMRQIHLRAPRHIMIG